MTVTAQDIKNLTPEHRVVWKEPNAPREVELGLWEDRAGRLWTDTGVIVRWRDGEAFAPNLSRIVRIIEPVEGEQPGCTGAGDCPATAHTHGCYADTEGYCEHPEEHGWTPPGERVKPTVDDVARVIDQADDDWQHGIGNGGSMWKYALARAVLALFPGRTETEVKAEGWDECARTVRLRDFEAVCDPNPYRADDEEADRG